MLGSSRIYREPTRLLPNDVVRFILWLSPPDKVPASLDSVRYDRPTFIKKFSLESISFTTISDISFCSFVNFRLVINVLRSPIDRHVTS